MSEKSKEELTPSKIEQILKVVKEVLILVGMFIAGNASACVANFQPFTNFQIF